MTAVAPSPRSKPKILIVDDEESILSAARRFLRGKQFEVLTSSSPSEALELVTKEDCWVVVSDYRMPEMTGTEFLEQVKKRAPSVTRLMLTGFLELPIIQEAINRASVFRFITKPWDETELLLGIETALQHSGRQKTNTQLIQEITAQNERLEQLTRNLESEVLKRTQGIEESKVMAESKQRLVRELTGFVKNLSRVGSVSDLYEVLFQEMQKFAGVSTPYLLVTEDADSGKLVWNHERTRHEKVNVPITKNLKSLAVRGATQEDKKWWATNARTGGPGKNLMELVVVPIRARETPASQPLAVLFVEHQLGPTKLVELLDRVTERLQPVSIVLDKILLREQLVAAARQWEATFNGFSDPIAVVDQQERVIRANKHFLKAGSQRCHEMFDDRSEICVGCPMPETIATMEAGSGLVRTASDKTFRVHSYPVMSVSEQTPQDKVVRVVNHYTDISNERDLYMKLVQSEKLAAVGLLAGNIAHELNNPLSGILALAQIIQKEMEDSDPHKADIFEVEKAAGRCQQIIRNLLNFSEPSQNQLEDTDLNELISLTLPLLKTALRTQNTQTLFSPDLPLVRIQPSQMQQVVFNLINNACQAMSSGGTLTIKTWAKGARVGFSITDTGPGIAPELHRRIFEPFFTTKSVGVGTGLGLSVSRGIVEKLGGTLTLSSTVGQGTTFTVTFPSQSVSGTLEAR